MTRSPLRPDELLGFRLAQLTRRLLEYWRCKLHWFGVDSPVLAHPGRDVLQTLERLQGEGDETPFRPPRIRRPPTARRYAELGFDVRKKLHRAEITARRGNFTPPLGPEPLSDPIHVELSLHRLLRGEVPDGEVLVAENAIWPYRCVLRLFQLRGPAIVPVLQTLGGGGLGRPGPMTDPLL